jgi:hypothetical protein
MAVAGVGVVAGGTAGAGNHNPAVSEATCNLAGGSYNSDANSCTIVSTTSETTMEAGQSDGFVLRTDTITTYVWITGGGQPTDTRVVVHGDPTCVNPGGQEVPSHIPPCQP